MFLINWTPKSTLGPGACGSRQFSGPETKSIKTTVQDLLATGVIRPSNSPWRAQVLVVDLDEPNSKPRMVVECGLFTDSQQVHSIGRLSVTCHRVCCLENCTTQYLQHVRSQVGIPPGPNLWGWVAYNHKVAFKFVTFIPVLCDTVCKMQTVSYKTLQNLNMNCISLSLTHIKIEETKDTRRNKRHKKQILTKKMGRIGCTCMRTCPLFTLQ